jgi:NifU-like protein involved in Fe-S cluster formation
LRIEDGRVEEARFQTSGCGYLVASCGALIELANCRTLEACRAITELQIIEHLGGLPEPRRYCAVLAVAALRDALDQWAPAQARESAA